MEYPGPDVSAFESETEESTWVFEEDQVEGGIEDVEATGGEGEEVSQSLELIPVVSTSVVRVMSVCV